MKFQWKRYVCLLLTLAILTPLCTVPAKAASTYTESYMYYLYLQHGMSYYTNSATGGYGECTIQVPSSATKAEILTLIEDWVEDNIVIDQNGLRIGSLKGRVARSKSGWSSDYRNTVYLYIGGGSVRSHQIRCFAPGQSPDGHTYIGGGGNCASDDKLCAGDVYRKNVNDPTDSGFLENLKAEGQALAGMTITYGGRRYKLDTSRSVYGSWGRASEEAYFSGKCQFKHYYVRDPLYSTVFYQLTGSIPPGITAPNSAVQADGEYMAIQPAATAPGYNFSNWSTSDVTTVGSGFTMPTHNVTFNGCYVPRTDTPYTVKFYVQNANNSGYTEQTGDSVTSTGTTDTQIRAGLDMAALNVKYPYCHLTDASKDDTTVIKGDGTAVLNLYYDRQTTNVSYIYSGAVPKTAPDVPTATVQKYGASVSLAAAPTLAGYDFSGWTSADAAINGGSFIMPVNDVTLTGSWTPRTDTPYTVEYYQQNVEDDDYTLADTEHCTGTTDTVAIVPGKSYPGFTPTPESLTATSNVSIQGDGSTILKLYYNRNVNTVSYAYLGGETDTAAPALPVSTSYRFGQTVPIAKAPSLAGYDFSGWTTSDAPIVGGSFTMPDSAVSITGAWTARTDTPYTVEYYQQNIEDDGYTLTDTEHCTGTTGGVAMVPDKSYPGFSITPESTSAAANVLIKSDGTTVLKLYYDRNVNTVSYAYSGETDVTPPLLPAGGSYRYGQTVPMAEAPTLPGYDFSGWTTSDASIVDGSFTMPDTSVNITGAWTAKADTPYVVEYYQQNTEDDAYTLAFTFNGTGVTGTGVPHKEFEGFTQTPDSLTAEGSAKIRSDGSTVLKLYYDRNINTVSYAYSGETDVTPPELPSPASYRYGQTVPVAAAPSLAGYDFGGWETSDVPVVDGSFTMPDEAVTITGAWTTRTDIPYVIEYYQQNTEDDGYTLANILNGEGAIGGSIPHREFEGFTETSDSVTAEGNARIRSDGSTVLKLYYDRDYYAISFTYSGSAPEAAPALPERANYRYGASVPLPVVPSAVGGMSFSGWTAGNVPILRNTFSVPAQDTKITGTWTQLFDSGDAPIPDTPVTPVTLEDNGTAYIIGYEDGAFRPDNYLTAKHETLMLSRLGLPVTSPSVAPALSAEERYITRKEFLGALLNASGAAAEDSEPMAKAAALGWISGYGDGGLYPNAYITRAQAVTIINRAFGRTSAQAGSAQISYTDIPRDYWAYDAIMAASTTM